MKKKLAAKSVMLLLVMIVSFAFTPPVEAARYVPDHYSINWSNTSYGVSGWQLFFSPANIGTPNTTYILYVTDELVSSLDSVNLTGYNSSLGTIQSITKTAAQALTPGVFRFDFTDPGWMASGAKFAIWIYSNQSPTINGATAETHQESFGGFSHLSVTLSDRLNIFSGSVATNAYAAGYAAAQAVYFVDNNADGFHDAAFNAGYSAAESVLFDQDDLDAAIAAAYQEGLDDYCSEDLDVGAMEYCKADYEAGWAHGLAAGYQQTEDDKAILTFAGSLLGSIMTFFIYLGSLRIFGISIWSGLALLIGIVITFTLLSKVV